MNRLDVLTFRILELARDTELIVCYDLHGCSTPFRHWIERRDVVLKYMLPLGLKGRPGNGCRLVMTIQLHRPTSFNLAGLPAPHQ